MAKKSSLDVTSILQKYSTQKDVEMLSTGVVSIDDLFGGGVAPGYVYGFYAEPGTGKSSICLQIVKSLCKQEKKCLIVDVEKSINDFQLESFGLTQYKDNGTLSIVTVTYFNELEEVVKAIAESDFNAVMIDSISAVLPFIDKNSNATLMQVGIRSRQASNVVSQMKALFYQKNILSLLIFQARANINTGGNMYAPTYVAAGGFVEKHLVDVMLKMQTSSKVKGDNDEIIGNKVWLECEKNKFTKPFQRKQSTLIFGKGILKRIEIVEASLEKGLIEQRGSFFVVPGMEENVRGRKALYELPNEVLRNLQDMLKE